MQFEQKVKALEYKVLSQNERILEKEIVIRK